MIRHHNQPVRKAALHTPIRPLHQLLRNRRVTRDPYGSRTPPLDHGCDEDAKRLFRKRHVSVVELWVQHLQGSTKELRRGYGHCAGEEGRGGGECALHLARWADFDGSGGVVWRADGAEAGTQVSEGIWRHGGGGGGGTGGGGRGSRAQELFEADTESVVSGSCLRTHCWW